MGTDLTYSNGKDELEFRVSPLEAEILMRFGKNAGYKKAIESITEVDEETGEGEIPTKILLLAVIKVMDAFKDEKILPCSYLIESKVNSNKGELKMLCGRISGVKINNKFYIVNGGLNTCELIPVTIDEAGKGREGKPVDIRDKTSIATDNMGELKIRKKRKSISLLSSLKKLKTFLEKTDSEVIKKILC